MPSGNTKPSDRTKKRQESYTHCEYIAASLEWLGKLTKQSLLEASGDGAGKYCEDKQRRLRQILRFSPQTPPDPQSIQPQEPQGQYPRAREDDRREPEVDAPLQPHFGCPAIPEP